MISKQVSLNTGDRIWVVERDCGEPIDISCILFLAITDDCVIATAQIHDYDIDGIMQYHIQNTSDNFGTSLLVYPIEDCFLTEEEAEALLEEDLEE